MRLRGELERFLIFYQSDRPLVPFLYDDLYHLIKSIIKRVLKPDVYESIKTADDIFKINL